MYAPPQPAVKQLARRSGEARPALPKRCRRWAVPTHCSAAQLVEPGIPGAQTAGSNPAAATTSGPAQFGPRHRSVAQLVEPRAHNAEVAGSSPAGATTHRTQLSSGDPGGPTRRMATGAVLKTVEAKALGSSILPPSTYRAGSKPPRNCPAGKPGSGWHRFHVRGQAAWK